MNMYSTGMYECWHVHSRMVTLSQFCCNVGDVTFLAATRVNSNAMLILAFLYKFVNLLKSYFDPINDHAIRKNFVLVYELLDGKNKM